MATEPLSLMDRRLALQEILVAASGLNTDNVHFQPPTGTEMDFSNGVITYSRSREAIQFADNLPYHKATAWSVTVIHKDPDNGIRDKIAALPYCSFDRWYATDGLNHDVYTLFY